MWEVGIAGVGGKWRQLNLNNNKKRGKNLDYHCSKNRVGPNEQTRQRDFVKTATETEH